MALSQKLLRENNVQFDSVINALNNHREETAVLYPFDASFDDKTDNHILTKILFVNYLDSTQIKNINIDVLKNHINNVLADNDFEVLHQGVLNEHGLINERYFEIVDNLSTGHHIIGTGKTKEDNLTSFASKFCGRHNQNSPFWDNQVSVFVKYLNYRHAYRNYRAYVESLLAIKQDYGLINYSLRDIEHAMWLVSNDYI